MAMFEDSIKVENNKVINDDNQSKKDELPYPVWEFNYKPERYIHKSWLYALPNGEILEKLMNDGRDTERLSNYLLSQLGFNGKFFFDFSNISSQVALWSGHELNKLVMYTGLACHCKDIRQLIIREHVLALRESIGGEMYDFAMKRVRTFIDTQPNLLDYADDIRLNDRIVISGLVCLHSYMRRFPIAFMKRVIIKFPRDWFDYLLKYSPQISKEKHKQVVCLEVIEKTIREVEKDNLATNKKVEE
ncbi:MAG: SctK family type III secretion system sorting platform protein [Cocleimonas sp.]|nr:SctK family type III secretion system sorting platform protein [Cocleimonas sp.]